MNLATTLDYRANTNSRPVLLPLIFALRTTLSELPTFSVTVPCRPVTFLFVPLTVLVLVAVLAMCPTWLVLVSLRVVVCPCRVVPTLPTEPLILAGSVTPATSADMRAKLQVVTRLEMAVPILPVTLLPPVKILLSAQMGTEECRVLATKLCTRLMGLRSTQQSPQTFELVGLVFTLQSMRHRVEILRLTAMPLRAPMLTLKLPPTACRSIAVVPWLTMGIPMRKFVPMT